MIESCVRIDARQPVANVYRRTEAGYVPDAPGSHGATRERGLPVDLPSAPEETMSKPLRGRLASSALFALVTAMATAARAGEGVPRIVTLGDSLTSGHGIGRSAAYPAVLQERLDEGGYDYQVINAGVSGDTTSRALRRYREALDGDVKILIVALGANDGLRGVAVEQLKTNLSVIIEDAQRRGIDVVLVGMDALPVRGWNYSVAFHRAYEELAMRYRIPLVPFILMRVMTDPSLMQRDHAHPNEAGARAIADLVWPYLQPLLKRTA